MKYICTKINNYCLNLRFFRWRRHIQDPKVSYWTVFIRENGHMEIYSLPELKLSYLVANVGLGHHILADSLAAPPTLAQNHSETGK